MTLEEFNALTDEEKSAYLSGAETLEKNVENLTAERDSLTSDNNALNKEREDMQKELKATKELNFSLARKINVGQKEDPEETLYNFMKGTF